MKEDKYKQYKSEVFEYEDFGRPSMYLWSILTVFIGIGLAILFAMVVASGFIAAAGAVNG